MIMQIFGRLFSTEATESVGRVSLVAKNNMVANFMMHCFSVKLSALPSKLTNLLNLNLLTSTYASSPMPATQARFIASLDCFTRRPNRWCCFLPLLQVELYYAEYSRLLSNCRRQFDNASVGADISHHSNLAQLHHLVEHNYIGAPSIHRDDSPWAAAGAAAIITSRAVCVCKQA